MVFVILLSLLVLLLSFCHVHSFINQATNFSSTDSLYQLDTIYQSDSEKIKLEKIKYKMMILKFEHEKQLELLKISEMNKFEERKLNEMKFFEAYKLNEMKFFEEHKLSEIGKESNRRDFIDAVFKLLSLALAGFLGVYFSNYLQVGLTGKATEFTQFFDALITKSNASFAAKASLGVIFIGGLARIGAAVVDKLRGLIAR